MPETVHDVLARARDGYAALGEVAEAVEDEWTYINDLTAAWRARFDAVDAERGTDPTAARPAIERLIEEVALIEDPHRAIDWLSTFPQVVLLAIGERP